MNPFVKGASDYHDRKIQPGEFDRDWFRGVLAAEKAEEKVDATIGHERIAIKARDLVKLLF